MLVYLAGPMRGRHLFNYQQFEDVTLALESAGWRVVSPHNEDLKHDWVRATWDVDDSDGCARRLFRTVELAPTFDLDRVLLHDCRLIDSCEAIMLLPGWQRSAGVRRELEHAMDNNKRLFFYGTAAPEHPTPVSWADVRALFREQDNRPTVETRVVTAGEVRVTDPVTGGQKGRKRAQLGAVDPQALLRVAEVAGFGADKYERLNFLKGYRWSLSFDALCRHLFAFWNGEDNDPESGLPHTAHAVWHGLALLAFAERGIGTDDRFKGAA